MNREDQVYQSLYRKWRPSKFEEVAGQSQVVEILKNSVKRNNVSHAYLFAGPRGTGKTSAARILAKAVNCTDQQDGEPCNECSSCTRIEEETSLDVVEIDGASNRGIDEIRQLREEVNFLPAQTDYKVYIIDEVHMLTNQAFNALLKTLEEPPDRVIFIFATTEPQKVPTTIISRCQVFEFKNLPQESIVERLTHIKRGEEIEITDEALTEIAEQAEGSMRDALVILEQMLSYQEAEAISKQHVHQVLGLATNETAHGYLNAILTGGNQKAIELLREVFRAGKDVELFVKNLVSELRNALLADDSFLERDVDQKTIIVLSRQLLNLLGELHYSQDKELVVEISTLELIEEFGATNSASPDGDTTTESSAPEEPDEESTTTSPVQDQPPSTKTSNQQPLQQTDLSPDSNKLDIWRSMINHIEEERISVAAFLDEAVPRFDETRIHIQFAPEFTFHKESLTQSKNLRFVQQKVQEFFGQHFSVDVEFESELPNNNVEDVLSQKTELVQEEFDATLIDSG